MEIKNDLPAAHMKKAMDEYRSKDHRPYDCFVCCILSHGRKGVMFGTDDKEVAIRDITSYFSASRCPSLQKKPKVFFIQACQGSEKQDGVTVEEDGFIHLLEEDAVRATRFTIPDEADFLLGMATVEGYVSFRHVVEGTWYIQSLCANLEEYCPRYSTLLQCRAEGRGGSHWCVSGEWGGDEEERAETQVSKDRPKGEPTEQGRGKAEEREAPENEGTVIGLGG